ncbi:Uma2 family endonuclease [Tychonema sp. LEGE 07199]|uniref:Uma2 family endonuclease n=1 Tax=unclassified Tychonema TaxID=2642144 RepID=UPI0018819DFC|nr:MULTISPECIES: Uma2 family endonuclease [unclassified Tychonema]MBE9119754.1 Uma2 family endonuclease [Tychonema sp. LEGE 07199]MBE9131645.1 Uma2 family endonuclease [Tychonema sp. LEGE 07196]
MIAITKQKLKFNEFITICPEDGVYELVNGEIVKMATTRNHDDVAEFADRQFYQECDRLKLNYVVKRGITIKTTTKEGIEQGRVPDVSVIDRTLWRAERKSYTALESPIQLAVEVVSTNWEDDYVDKLDEYERLGIAEYWIIDYLAIGKREYLGNPKIPTVFVFSLNAEGKYQRTQFRDNEQIVSPTFPELVLNAGRVLLA